METQPISLLVCALGGEGGGVLSEWLVDVARQTGYAAQSTSIPGVAQRTGATTYYIEVFPIPLEKLDGRRPIFSLNPVPGALDAMVSSELLETTRQVANGMSAADRTLVITSSSRTFTTQERMQLGDGRADSDDMLKVVRQFSREQHVFDMGAAAKEAGTIVSAVMLGAIAGSGVFPFSREEYENVIREGGGRAAEASLAGFAKGFDSVQAAHIGVEPNVGQAGLAPGCHAGLDPASRDLDVKAEDTGLRVEPAMTTASPAMTGASRAHALEHLPAQVREIAALGHARVVEYQDAAYGRLYLERLSQVLAAEREAGGQANREANQEAGKAFAITNETARWLALWMAFDDIVRVADLKSRASRSARVRREVKAADEDLVRVYDHFKPGAPEFAALLPPSFAQRVLAWDRQRIASGKEAWALPLKVGTHSALGMLALRVLAAMKGLRRVGSRFALEQKMMGQWLQGIVAGTQRDWRLGHEIALCGRLIKGYGTTNERGKENLVHILEHLAQMPSAAQAADAIGKAREAALADDAGKALDAELLAHGAPPRPVKAVPIRFMRRPATGKT